MSRGMYWINTNNSRNVIANNLFTGKCTYAAVAVDASNINNDVCFNTFAIETTGHAIRTFGTKSNFNRIYGNIVSVKGTGGCIYVNSSSSLQSFNANGNLYHFGTSGKLGTIGATSYTTLATWQAATALLTQGQQDTNSLVGDPKFTSATDLRLKPTSPAINKAIIYAGRHNPVVDFDGYVRGPKQDIGAFETTAYKPYGTGCKSSGGLTPVASISGNIGQSETFLLNLTKAPASSNGALAIGGIQASVNLGGSCNLLVQPLILVFMATDASGNWSLKTTTSATLAIQGLHAFVQFGVFDVKIPSGMAVSNGVDFRF